MVDVLMCRCCVLDVFGVRMQKIGTIVSSHFRGGFAVTEQRNGDEILWPKMFTS